MFEISLSGRLKSLISGQDVPRCKLRGKIYPDYKYLDPI